MRVALLVFVALLWLFPQTAFLPPAAGASTPLAPAGRRVGPSQVRPSITYDPATNTIAVRRQGAVVTLSDIYNAVRDESLLERLGPSEWFLKANLKIFELVTLELHGEAAGGDVNWLKLRSEPSGYATIESSNGQISIRNTRITSWDPGAGATDTEFLDGSGRAFIAAKNRRSEFAPNWMDVIGSEIAYLGFFEETAYGISWKVISEPEKGDTGILGQGMTGKVSGSKFHHNYFGLYVWGVGDMEVRNNEFYENYSYGFDAHTVTRRTILEDNYSHDNGLHGIIFADRCTENVVRRNRSVNNRGHGIMLHESSDNNIVEDNFISGSVDGIPLFESSNNVVAGNVVRDSVTGIRVYGRAVASRGNLFEGNEIATSKTYGVWLYDAAEENTFRDNRVISNGDAGIYLVSVANNIFAGNVIQGNESGIQLDFAAVDVLSSGNQFRNNTISDNRQFGLYSNSGPEANPAEGNRFSGNPAGDTRYPDQSLAGAPRRPLIQIIALFIFLAILAAAIAGPLVTHLRSRKAKPG